MFTIFFSFHEDALSTDDDNNLKSDQYRYGYQLVELIRRHFGNYFVVIVAGYPCGHPEAPSYEEDLRFLKLKVCRCPFKPFFFLLLGSK
jgi:5,10-methylenetetrahydrofolate reductase